MVSAAHEESALHAIDFIRDNADNAPVVAPYAGTVVFNGKDSGGNSTLVLEHSVQRDGRTVYFYTKYLHMHVNAQGVVVNAQGAALVPGTQVAAGASIGLVGSVGQSSGPHLHEELLIATNGGRIAQKEVGEKSGEFFTTKAVDQRLLLTTGHRAIGVKAQAGYVQGEEFIDRGRGRVSVQWEEGVGWVDMSANVVYDRREQETGSDGGTYWLAYEPGLPAGQMARVEYDKTTQAWYQWDSVKSKFFENTTGMKRQWFPNIQKWSYDL